MANFKSSMVGLLCPTTGNSTSNPNIPVPGESEYWYLSLPPHLYLHFVTLSFYDNTHGKGLYGDQFDPTEGHVIVEVSDNGKTYGPVANGSIDLSQPFQQPNFMGHAHSIRLKFTGVKPLQDGISNIVIVDTYSYN